MLHYATLSSTTLSKGRLVVALNQWILSLDPDRIEFSPADLCSTSPVKYVHVCR